MAMFATWAFGAVMLVVGGSFLVTILWLAAWRQTIVWQSMWCPSSGRPFKKLFVVVAFLTDSFPRRRYRDVLCCSAFADPSRVSCDKRCLGFMVAQQRERVP
jgi:hypothetical protein